MKPNQGVLVAVVCIAVLMLTLGVPTASARGTSGAATAGPAIHTFVVKPNGHDDTSDIQAAFTACTSHNWVCTIQLVKGTYYAGPVFASGFLGGFVGAGVGKTIVQTLPNLLVVTPDAAPSLTSPWPDLFTFVNGAFQISGMTMNEPYATPTTGWSGPYGPTTALLSFVLVTGTQANVAISGVAMLGTAGDWEGFNVVQGIYFLGGVTSLGGMPLAGTFSVTFTYMNDILVGIYWADTADASEVACFNAFDLTYNAIGFQDMSNSQLVICYNYIQNEQYFSGIIGLQSYAVTGLLPSNVNIVGNVLTNVSDAGDGILLYDYGAFEGIPATLTAMVSGNYVQTNTSCECFIPEYPAIGVFELVSFVASGNTIVSGGSGFQVWGGPGVFRGNLILGAPVGVWVQYANGIDVTGNVVKNSAQYGIEVSDGSSNIVVSHNLVKNSGSYDLYWDGSGTGNAWIGNICQTSSPSGLC